MPTAPDATDIVSLPLLPLDHGVVFPDMVVNLRLDTDESRAAVEAVATEGRELLLVPRIDGGFATVGTAARVEQTEDLDDGGRSAVVRGLSRARVGRGSIGAGPLEVEAIPIPPADASARATELADEYRDVATRLLGRIGGRRLAVALKDVDDPGALADTLGWWPSLSFERRVDLLETVEPEARIAKALDWVREADAEAEVDESVERQVGEELDQGQREAILRRRLAAIRAELGEGDEDDLDEYRRRLAEDDLPDEVVAAVGKELDRLEQLGPQQMESSWMRTWIETVLDVPWAATTDDTTDLDGARAVLDADHTGLEEVKDRIVEFLAVRKLRRDRGRDAGDRRGGAILALVGPPGVGKTSLGESVARALGREFVRMSLGGVRDEAEIRGHRRTYVGARPGRIVKAITDAGVRNPVILLDEIDKVGSDWRGDPSSALLEVLDPAQNGTFRDHYLEVELDLSDVVFIATGNVAEQIPGPLYDRMEVITLEGYSGDEKLAIATDHLLPRLLATNGLDEGEVVIDAEVVRRVVDDHTHEAGVRSLERRLDRLVRRAATRLVVDPSSAPVRVTEDDIRDALGAPAHREDPAERTERPGVATGLAVTGAGGDILFVEAVGLDGEPGLTLTGQLGEVMRESGEIALSYLRANRDALGIGDPPSRLHVHFPAGAVPKDGPSAGVTMATALASLLTGRRVRGDVAMTGEITLQGRVLPIGGVKQKALAAHRAGVATMVLPEGNRHDVDDIPEAVRDALDITLVSDIGEVLDVALAT